MGQINPLLIRQWHRGRGKEELRAVQAVADAMQAADDLLTEVIWQAYKAGANWSEIGMAIGWSKQTVRNRYRVMFLRREADESEDIKEEL